MQMGEMKAMAMAMMMDENQSSQSHHVTAFRGTEG
jgi:hypothetical protein